MSTEKIVSLVTKLYNQTSGNKLKWVETAVKSEFQASFPNYSVHVKYETDPDNSRNYYYLVILNEEGDIIDVVGDYDIEEFTGVSSDILRRLFEEARRSALGVNAAVDSILSALDENN